MEEGGGADAVVCERCRDDALPHAVHDDVEPFLSFVALRMGGGEAPNSRPSNTEHTEQQQQTSTQGEQSGGWWVPLSAALFMT
jgi:hypothetical protein